MSEYCSQCSPFKELGGFDWNLPKIALELDPGHSYSFECEGCNNRALYKNEEGRLWLYQEVYGENDLEPVAVNLDDL